MQETKFAAFIITFERPEVLQVTLQKILAQTYPPAYVLVVDNSYSESTEALMADFSGAGVAYHRVGYNSGPAGAAKIGLQKLTKLGYKWIYWGDDDNPPTDIKIFQRCFRNIGAFQKKGAEPGILGGKGGYLNKNTGRIRSLANHELEQDKFPEVDSVPGGHTLLVNSDIVKAGVLPDERLFFGFEELDFCLKAKEKGFKITIDAEAWLDVRRKAKNADPNYQWKGSTFGKEVFLTRDYYSSRNLLMILYSHKYYKAFLFRFFMVFLKSFVGFKFGWNYGFRNLKVQWQAMFDAIVGIYSNRNFGAPGGGV